MARGHGNQLMEPTRYHTETKTRASSVLALAGVVLVLIFAALPAFAGRGLIQDLIFVFYMLALAQCWNMLAGYAGLVSVGQQAFVGLGGYLLFALTIGADIDPIAAVVLSGLIAAAFEVRSPAARDIITYWIALALAAGAPLLVYLVLRSRYGLALFAIRDSEATAETSGVDSFRTKLGVYVLVAAATGMIGALIYLQKARISPDAAFSVLDWSAYVIFIVIIGGVGTIEGPIIGVMVFYTMQHYL